ncbi:ABC transporter substrate-binding protein [Lacrimispora sp. NSJ-141]|uniref:ABC transporter substrate-binding protein n=1 Tax=Lientehia hominis TaxID=2897778 RepID=A0AAP2W8W3_9FIRM|nr:ABC transporter substrate-binding protein [Lientehia hominis]MCD2492566.1 ABC transporter substrate-binding protein [Lientehia hominis]
MKRRGLAVCLTALMILSMLGGCGTKKANETAASRNTADKTTAVETTASDTNTKETETSAAPSNLVKKGTLTYAVAATFPPFEYMKDEDYAGFDIEMGEALAKEMGLEAEIMDMTFDGLINALKGGRCDIINSAMYIKPEREEQVDFVRYLTLGDTILVRTGTAEELGIAGPDDLPGKTVAVTAGAVEEMKCNELNEQFQSEGKEAINILSLPTSNDAVLAVRNSQADCMIYSSPSAAYLQEEEPGVFDAVTTFDNDTEIGIAVRKGDTEMKEAVETALQRLVENGTYAELMKKYNLPEELSYFK